MNACVIIGSCYPPDMLEELIVERNLQDIPANVLCWKLACAASTQFESVTILNERKEDYSLDIKEACRKFSFSGIDFIDRSYKTKSKVRRAKTLLKDLDEFNDSIIIVYSLSTAYLLPAVLHARKSGSPLVLVVPDLPRYMSDSRSLIYLVLKRIDSLLQRILLRRVNGYVLLCETMSTELPIGDKPYIVMEGIADAPDTTSTGHHPIDFEKFGEFILYAGGVSSLYGLPEFVQNFINAELEGVKLVICGDGDYAAQLQKIIKVNHIEERVIYLGKVGREKVLCLESAANLLVNPRSASDIYTRFSFPSKTMEYLASGTPVMMERLMGVPEEYYDYIILVEEGRWVEHLRAFFSCSQGYRASQGRRGASFIETEKTVGRQGDNLGKLIRFVNSGKKDE